MVTAALLAVSLAAHGQVLSEQTVGPVGGANALSPPAARHLVRMPSGAYLLALQQDGGTGLVLLQSDDDGRSWWQVDTLDADPAARQTADMVAVGDYVALVRSFDAPSILPDASLDPGRQVWFQWLKPDGAGSFTLEPPVLVFDPPAGSAFHRAEIAIDSLGRIWVQAFRRTASSCDPKTDTKCAMCVETGNGDNYANEVVVAVSNDAGRTFSPAQSIAQTLCRAGGRLSSVGQRLVLFWNDYSANEHGTRIVTQMVTRDDDDDLATWSAPAPAFPDLPVDGIYHGAAMSAVADGEGGLHLVYKDQNRLRLWYRHYDGASFGPPTQVDDSTGDWALQPATTLAGGELVIFDNHITASGYATRMWTLGGGLGADAAITLEDEDQFYGYPSAPETLDAGALAFLHSRTPDANSAGCEVALRVAAGPFDAVIESEPDAVVSDGSAGNASAVITPQTPFARTVALSISGAPAGASVVASDSTLAVEGEAAVAQVALDPGTAPNGDYLLSLNADYDSQRISAPLDWHIARAPPTGKLLSASAPVVLAAGKSVDLKLALDGLVWFRGAVAASAAGLPAGVSAAGTSIEPGAQGVVTLQAAANAADGVANSAITLAAAPMHGAIPFQLEVVGSPSVKVLSPLEGSVVSGNVRVALGGWVSEETSVAALDLLVDGEPVAHAADWEATWDSTTVPDGTHVLSARVVDGVGGAALSPAVPVVVQNEVADAGATDVPPPAADAGPAVPPAHGCSTSGAGAGFAALWLAMAALYSRRPRASTT